MSLVWKLLRRHVSVPQFAGFFFANLLGMLIVLLSVQFYYDVLPVFTQGDSFIKKDYLIVSKRISMVSSFSGRSNTFSAADIDEIKAQKFCKSVGAFTSSRYKVSASKGCRPERLPLRGGRSRGAHHFAAQLPDDLQFRLCPKPFAA